MAASASPSSDNVSLSPPSPAVSSSPFSITIQNIGSMVMIKLTTTNYLTWSALFAPIFQRYNLTSIVDGSQVAPPKYLYDTSENRTSTLNPDFVSWYENDQNILIWINSTLSDSLIPYIVGESSAALFLQRIEEIADTLASAGAPVDDYELISVTLHGLPPEFDSFGDAVQFRVVSTTLDELHGLLLSKEIQIENRKKFSSTPIQAFNTSTGILPTPTDPPNSQAYIAQSSSNFSSNQGRGSHLRNSQNRGNFRGNNQRNHYTKPNNQRYSQNCGFRFNNNSNSFTLAED
ncbi:hypothetical protein FF1_011830 [Malus domestica]